MAKAKVEYYNGSPALTVDGKVYPPLAESRDWREETCTISCFETLETPSES